MTTLEKTISIMKTLPEHDLLKIQRYVKKLSRKHKAIGVDEEIRKFLKPMTREDFLRDVEITEKQIQNI